MFDYQIEVLWALWDPVQFMLLSSAYGVVTIFNLVTNFQFGPLRSLSDFKDVWFATFWAAVGTGVKETAEPNVTPLLKEASGVILDIGPGVGLWLDLFDKEKVTKIYGVEPNKDHHALLRENIKKAGLADVYEILGVGVEDLESQGIAPGSIDTVVTIQCLCSIPTPRKMIQSLAGYIKPGGKWIVYEHVKSHQGGFIESYQSFLNIAWPHLFGGCSITRDTEKWLRESADWSFVSLKAPVDEKSYQVIPHTMGTLVK
ncbi:S-adenosyl-L-methionine-dependent methyltransferase [Xylogone sp. PMI_703]|nr:S-adenosyl-L-methionine-dependent methyltransferase [Xylogone sp. PMI_703]